MVSKALFESLAFRQTYIKIKGEWKYLYRAIDEQENTLDFYLSRRRNTIAAKKFLQKLIKLNKDCCPSVINTVDSRKE